LAGHSTTDELWPMNILAHSTRPWRHEHALFERRARMHGRTTGSRENGREVEGNLEFGTILRASACVR